MMWDDYDDRFDEDGEIPAECLFSSVELCQFVREAIEKKHNVTISRIDYVLGHFEFLVLTSGIDEMRIPFHWKPVAFGNGSVTFEISMEVFQKDYHKIEGRDFIDSVKVAMTRCFGSICDIISVKNQNDGFSDDVVEVVVRLKDGCKLSFEKSPWLPIKWVEGDMISMEVDGEALKQMLENSNLLGLK